MSNYGDTPASGVVREATGSLLEKVQADVAHVVNSLESICARRRLPLLRPLERAPKPLLPALPPPPANAPTRARAP